MGLANVTQLEFEFSESLSWSPRVKRSYRRRIAVNVIQLVFDFSVAIHLVSAEQLVSDYMEGDNASGEEIFRRYENVIQSYANKMSRRYQLPEIGVPSAQKSHTISVHRKSLKEEAYGTLCCHVATQVKLGKYSPRPGFTFGAWLKIVLQNHLMDMMRKCDRQPQPLSLHSEDPDELDEIERIEDNSYKSLDSNILVESALSSLTHEERVIVQIMISGDPGPNLAARRELGISRSRHEKLRQSAIDKLRTFFTDDEVARTFLH